MEKQLKIDQTKENRVYSCLFTIVHIIKGHMIIDVNFLATNFATQVSVIFGKDYNMDFKDYFMA